MSNLEFLKQRAAGIRAFGAGEIHTGFVEEHAADLLGTSMAETAGRAG